MAPRSRRRRVIAALAVWAAAATAAPLPGRAQVVVVTGSPAGPAFAAADVDRDGVVDEGEAGLDLAEAFLDLDPDGDGALSLEDLGTPSEGERFAALDADADGRLDFAEVAAAKRAAFRAADRDGDGRLSPAEVAAAEAGG